MIYFVYFCAEQSYDGKTANGLVEHDSLEEARAEAKRIMEEYAPVTVTIIKGRKVGLR